MSALRVEMYAVADCPVVVSGPPGEKSNPFCGDFVEAFDNITQTLALNLTVTLHVSGSWSVGRYKLNLPVSSSVGVSLHPWRQ